MVSYQQYVWLSMVGPLFFSFLGIFLIIVFFIRKCRGKDSGSLQYVQLLIGEDFLGGFKQKKIPGTDLFYYSINGNPVCYQVVDYLTPAVIAIVMISLAILTGTFVVRENVVDICQAGRTDCFNVVNLGFGSAFETVPIEPVLNCGQFTGGDATFVCYSYVFNFAEGLSRAGGFGFSMKVFLNISISVLTYATKSTNPFKKWLLYIGLYFILFLFGVAPFASLFLPDLVESNKGTGEVLEFTSYTVGMLVIIISTCASFYWLTVGKCEIGTELQEPEPRTS